MSRRIITRKVQSVCRGCPYETYPFVPGQGNLKADTMIVCRDPGEEEEREGKSLIGRVGKTLDLCLQESSHNRDDLYLTNIVKCRPPGNKAGTKDWVQAEKQCRKYLEYEIKKIKPKVVVPMGNEALRSVHPKAKGTITQTRGSVFVGEGYKVMPTFHPAYILRNDSQLPVVVYDLFRVHDELKSAEIATTDKGYKHTVVRTRKQFNLLVRKMLKHKEFTIDVETNMIDWWPKDAIIVCFSICFEDAHSYCIPMRNYKVTDVKVKNPETGRMRKQKHVEASLFWSKTTFKYIIKIMQRIFASPKISKDLQNAKFDLHHFLNDGISLPENAPLEDTLIRQYLIDENSPRGLKTMASVYAPHMAGYERQIKEEEEGCKNLVTVEPKILYDYNCGDTVATRWVKHEQKPRLIEEGQEDVYYDYMIPLLRLLFKMERRGVRIGKKEFRNVKREIESELAELTAAIREEVGEDINPNSGKQLAKELFEVRGLPVVKRTKKAEAPSTDLEALTILSEQYNDPLVDLLIKYSPVNKLHGTYVKGIHRRLDSNWRLHTNFKPTTVTGRLSSRNPNLQNIPKSGPIKGMFLPTEGYQLIVADLSQAELRVFAVISGDEALQEAFASGADIHNTVAEMVFGTSDIDGEQRRVAKTINFSVLYLKKPEHAAASIGMDPDEMRSHFDKFFSKFSKVRSAQRRIPRQALRDGYLTTVFGRKRRFNLDAVETDKELEHIKRQAVNFPPQSIASDINCKAAIRTQKRFERLGLDAHVLMMVHDSIIVEARNGIVKPAAKILHAEMTRPVPELNNTVFPVDIGFGPNWQKAEDVQGTLKDLLKRKVA